MNADNMLNFPDFRAVGKKAFSCLSRSVAEQAGENEMGQVIIQTSDPSNKIIQLVRTA